MTTLMSYVTKLCARRAVVPGVERTVDQHTRPLAQVEAARATFHQSPEAADALATVRALAWSGWAGDAKRVWLRAQEVAMMQPMAVNPLHAAKWAH